MEKYPCGCSGQISVRSCTVVRPLGALIFFEFRHYLIIYFYFALVKSA